MDGDITIYRAREQDERKRYCQKNGSLFCHCLHTADELIFGYKTPSLTHASYLAQQGRFYKQDASIKTGGQEGGCWSE
jgi:hypothetical protein